LPLFKKDLLQKISVDAKAALLALRELSDEDYKVSSLRFKIPKGGNLGVSHPKIKALAKEIGKDHKRALELWDMNFRGTRLLAIFTEELPAFSSDQADSWVSEIHSWELADAINDLVAKKDFASEKIFEWAKDDREFVRRTAFSTICVRALKRINASDGELVSYLPLIKNCSTDSRNFVKKAVNWALRHIGKKNTYLNEKAIIPARELAVSENKTAKWIGKDAIRELEKFTLRT